MPDDFAMPADAIAMKSAPLPATRRRTRGRYLISTRCRDYADSRLATHQHWRFDASFLEV